ncbi:MAG: TMEM198/TM7SF3 family protein [Lachnospiraceae bacterium]|nr:TMEM198/TM7SF3 family protein [Lachnospiraceae bacterium]
MEKVMDFLSMAAEELAQIQISTAGVTLAIGLLNCFLGYRLLKVWLSLTGFTIGALAGYTIASHYTRSSAIQITVLLLAGLLLGMIAFHIYRIGAFLLCSQAAVVSISILLQPKDSLKFMICLAAAIVVGLLGAAFVKPMVIFHTALGGGFAAAVSAAGLLHKEADAKIMFFGAALTAAGIVVQAVSTRKVLSENKKDSS